MFFKFVDRIYKDLPITLHNHGKIKHCFTFIDDVTECLIQTALSNELNIDFSSRHPIFNFGGPHVLLEDCVEAIKIAMGKTAKREHVPLPKGDRWYTFADSSLAKKELNFNPKTPIKKGISQFVDWYIKDYIPIINS